MSEITEEYSQLTAHPKGSVKELWSISFPLILSFLSGNLMIFFDRLILANYSLEGMSAAAAASITCMVFLYGAVGVASIAEIFVGQYNGEKNYQFASRPVWQMLWFSLIAGLIFIGIGLYGGPYLVSDYYYEEYGLPYFQWLLFFGITFPAQGAISSFFIGLGKVRIVTYTTVLANALNILFDLALVFGIEGVIAPMGVKGAAIATGIAQSIQVFIMLTVFLNRHHRKKYQSHDFHFKPKLFKKCLRIGGPSAGGHMIEIAAWAIITQLMVTVSELHLIAFVVGQTFYGLIAFAMTGLQKGVTTITANFIGNEQWDMVNKSWKSAVKLLLILATFFSLLMIVYPNPVIDQFIPDNLQYVSTEEVFLLLRYVCAFVWLYFILDGLTWISAGVLTAAGDTLFVMIMNAFTAWFFAFLPVYYFVYIHHISAYNSWLLMCLYASVNALFFYIRFKSGGWKERAKITS